VARDGLDHREPSAPRSPAGKQLISRPASPGKPFAVALQTFEKLLQRATGWSRNPRCFAWMPPRSRGKPLMDAFGKTLLKAFEKVFSPGDPASMRPTMATERAPAAPFRQHCLTSPGWNRWSRVAEHWRNICVAPKCLFKLVHALGRGCTCATHATRRPSCPVEAGHSRPTRAGLTPRFAVPLTGQ
jgi:hypothetical protein